MRSCTNDRPLVDGIHVQARLEEAAQCLLVIIGATPEGKKLN
jgi:putative transposase